VLDQRLQPVVREITDSRARTRDELEGTTIIVWFQKIFKPSPRRDTGNSKVEGGV